jgi:hypothetical protein
MRKIIDVLFLGYILTALFSCSEDRLNPLKESAVKKDSVAAPQVKFVNINDSKILASLKKPISKFQINSDSDLPIVTKEGTKLFIYPFHLKTATNQPVKYPYSIEYVELLTLKDMVLYNKPTMSYDRILNTAGAFYIKVTKDGNTLEVDNYPLIQFLNNKPDTKMVLFYEDRKTPNSDPTWVRNEFPEQKENVEGLQILRSFYNAVIGKFGWINIDKFYNYTGPKTQVTFKAEKINPNEIKKFMLFPKIKSVIGVYDNITGDLPIGEEVVYVAFAENSDGVLYSYFKNGVVQDKEVVTVKLAPTTKEIFEEELAKY